MDQSAKRQKRKEKKESWECSGLKMVEERRKKEKKRMWLRGWMRKKEEKKKKEVEPRVWREKKKGEKRNYIIIFS